MKEVYEKGLGGYYKNRKEPVSAPIDLVPAEMQEIHLEIARDRRWSTSSPSANRPLKPERISVTALVRQMPPVELK